jgi:hypothetical protein
MWRAEFRALPAEASMAADNNPEATAFPAGLARAPFLWNYLGHSYEMEFLGGFMGVWQDVTSLGLRPEIGWAIREQAVA